MLAGYMDKFEEQLRLRLPKLAGHFEVGRLANLPRVYAFMPRQTFVCSVQIFVGFG